MIKVENIYKSFDGIDVLKGITFEVVKGEILALIGRRSSSVKWRLWEKGDMNSTPCFPIPEG